MVIPMSNLGIWDWRVVKLSHRDHDDDLGTGLGGQSSPALYLPSSFGTPLSDRSQREPSGRVPGSPGRAKLTKPGIAIEESSEAAHPPPFGFGSDC